MMERGMMMPGMLRMMLALMDTDNDGAVSLAEFQAAHERIFRALDTNKDGRLTVDELQSLLLGHGDTGKQEGASTPGKPAQ